MLIMEELTFCDILGTVFLWMYWPSFNAALVAPDYVAQHRSVINTYFSLAAACVTTFALSPLFQREGTKWRLSMVRDNDFLNLKSLHSFNTTSCARKWENFDEHQIVKAKCSEIISFLSLGSRSECHSRRWCCRGNSVEHVNQSVGSSFDWLLCRSTEHRGIRIPDSKY